MEPTFEPIFVGPLAVVGGIRRVTKVFWLGLRNKDFFYGTELKLFSDHLKKENQL